MVGQRGETRGRGGGRDDAEVDVQVDDVLGTYIELR